MLCVVVAAGCNLTVAYLDEDVTTFAVWLVTGAVASVVAWGQLTLYLYFMDYARRAEAAEWRYEANQARSLREFVSNNHKR